MGVKKAGIMPRSTTRCCSKQPPGRRTGAHTRLWSDARKFCLWKAACKAVRGKKSRGVSSVPICLGIWGLACLCASKKARLPLDTTAIQTSQHLRCLVGWSAAATAAVLLGLWRLCMVAALLQLVAFICARVQHAQSLLKRGAANLDTLVACGVLCCGACSSMRERRAASAAPPTQPAAAAAACEEDLMQRSPRLLERAAGWRPVDP